MSWRKIQKKKTLKKFEKCVPSGLKSLVVGRESRWERGPLPSPFPPLPRLADALPRLVTVG